MKQDSSPLLSCCVIIICCHWILNGEIICDIPGNLRGNRVYGFGKMFRPLPDYENERLLFLTCGLGDTT